MKKTLQYPLQIQTFTFKIYLLQFIDTMTIFLLLLILLLPILLQSLSLLLLSLTVNSHPVKTCSASVKVSFDANLAYYNIHCIFGLYWLRMYIYEF